MLFLIEGKINDNQVKYLYAACTHPEFRRMGIMEKLLKYSEDYCRKLGYSAIFLVPANEHLYGYYKKFGYVDSFKKYIAKINYKISAPEISFDATEDVDKVLFLRKKLISGINSFVFSDEVMKYSFNEHLYNGGNILYFDNKEKSALAFYYNTEDGVIIKELLCNSEDLVGSIIKHFHNKNVENLYFFTPIVYNCKDIVGEYTKCGMCLALNEEISDYLTSHNDLYAALYLD